MNFHRYLLPNNFVYFKILIKDGWVNKDTGKKSDPRIQFTDAKQLQDILGVFAKKLIIYLDIKHLNTDLIHDLNSVFRENKGENTVVFEVLETQIIKKTIDLVVENENDEEIPENSNDDSDQINESVNITTEIDEIKTITKIEMPSRKLKIKISSQLLNELERLKINFSLN